MSKDNIKILNSGSKLVFGLLFLIGWLKLEFIKAIIQNNNLCCFWFKHLLNENI